MRPIVAACLVSSALALLPGRAGAVIVEGGTIQANAADTTVDLYDFTFTASGTFNPGLAEENDTPPIGHPAIDLYSVVGNTAMLVGTASAIQAGSVQLNAAVNPGNYIMAVSEAPLAPGNFGPLNPASTNKVGYFFEFGISGAFQDDVIEGCTYAGSLNGTFSFMGGPESCPATPALPICQASTVPEPDSAAILAAGLGLALAGIGCHRRWL